MQEETIQLPRKTKEGKPRISYSQFNLWLENSSFNMGKEGWMEYVCVYFLGFSFEDSGWGEFGKDTEAYICFRDKENNFNEKEKYILDEIVPLGVFQKEIEHDFGNFVLYGIVDDMTTSMDRIRDYKTASEKSSGKYRKEDYYQLLFYCLIIWRKFGVIPEAEVCVVERKGNCSFTKKRKDLTVGDNIWYIPNEITVEKMEAIEIELKRIVEEISCWFKIFNRINTI